MGETVSKLAGIYNMDAWLQLGRKHDLDHTLFAVWVCLGIVLALISLCKELLED